MRVLRTMQLNFHEYKTTEKPKQLVILLHGYGSNSADLISLAPEFLDIMPYAHFVSPNAPQAYEGGFRGAYQWYSLYDRSDEAMFEGAVKSSRFLVEFIEEHLHQTGLDYEHLVLAGFSQGGMMTIHNALRLPKRVLAAISFSGYLAGASKLDREIISRPEFLLTHGTEDNIVPLAAHEASYMELRKHNLPVERFVSKGLSHGIDLYCINAAKAFLSKQLKIL
jgi:phospholipase/carboxylesterase